MERVNISLDKDLFDEVERLAKREKSGIASVARQLLQEALMHRRRRDLHRRMASAYAAGAKDPVELAELAAHESGQDELLRDDE